MNTSPSMSLKPGRPIIRVIPITTWEPGNMLFDFWQKYKRKKMPSVLADIEDKQFTFLQYLSKQERVVFFQTAYDLAEQRAIACNLSANVDVDYVKKLAFSNSYEINVRLWFLEENRRPHHDYRLRVTVWGCKIFHDLLDLHFKLTELYHLYRSRPTYLEQVRSGFIKDDYGRFGDLL